MASDDGNGVGGVSDYVLIDKEKCVDDDECVVEVKECDESELIGKRVSSLGVAFEVYNEYDFRKGFSIRCDKLPRREGSQEVRSREFCCGKQGVKRCPGKQDKTFTKRSRRCNCKARVIFYIESNGEWVCKKHNMVHNHELLLEDEVHKLRSHKKVEKAHVNYFQKIRRNGMKVSDAYRLPRNEAEGSPSLGFSERDTYNSVANEVKGTLDGAMPTI